MNKKNPIVSLLTERELPFEVLAADRAEEVIRLWWNSFSRPDSPSTWFNRRRYWHCFSFGHKPCLSYDPAIREYQAVVAKKVWLLAVSLSAVVAEVRKQDIPVSVLRGLQEKQQILDLYVLDKAGSWTFVRTHEDASKLGPYFSRREWNPVSGQKV